VEPQATPLSLAEVLRGPVQRCPTVLCGDVVRLVDYMMKSVARSAERWNHFHVLQVVSGTLFMITLVTKSSDVTVIRSTGESWNRMIPDSETTERHLSSGRRRSFLSGLRLASSKFHKIVRISDLAFCPKFVRWVTVLT
jgi:hypothetical protein